MEIESVTTLRRRPDVIAEAVADDVVVLDPSTSRYVRLNGTAAALWEALGAGPASIEALAGVLELRGAPPDRARADAAAFVTAMTDRGLVLLEA